MLFFSEIQTVIRFVIETNQIAVLDESDFIRYHNSMLCLGCKSWYELCAWRAGVFICTQTLFSSKCMYIWPLQNLIVMMLFIHFLSYHTCSSQVNNFVVFSGFFQSRSGNAWLHHCSSVFFCGFGMLFWICASVQCLILSGQQPPILLITVRAR